MNQSILLNTDAYKVSMNLMYPPKCSSVYSYIESRGGKYKETVFFGIQTFIDEYLLKPITMQDIDEAEIIWNSNGQIFDRGNWEHILHKHNGYLPLEIKSVAEGSVVPTNNVLVTIENTDPNCFWLTTWIESSLLRAIWYPTTVASQGYHIKKNIKEDLDKSGDSPIEYKLHDFSLRGVSSNESATIGGMAHLVNFSGTDTISGIIGVKRYYDTILKDSSVIASEHSVICSWGKENESGAYKNMLSQFQDRIISIVSDSYDIYNACRNIYGKELKEDIINLKCPLVIRPDSGDPLKVICGDNITIVPDDVHELLVNDWIKWELRNNFEIYEYEHGKHGPEKYSEIFKVGNRYVKGTVELGWNRYDKKYYYVDEYDLLPLEDVIVTDVQKGTVQILDEEFDSTINSKGYKVLNHVRILQGDGIDAEVIEQILKRLVEMGYSADNILFGMGGQNLQKVDRDTLKFAMKCSAVCIDDEWIGVQKDSITDSGKRSKIGRVTLYKDKNGYYSGVEDWMKSELHVVYKDGKSYNRITFDEVRKNTGLW